MAVLIALQRNLPLSTSIPIAQGVLAVFPLLLAALRHDFYLHLNDQRSLLI